MGVQRVNPRPYLFVDDQPGRQATPTKVKQKLLNSYVIAEFRKFGISAILNYNMKRYRINIAQNKY